MQEGILFHGLYSEEAAAYIEQLKCRLHGVDITAFKQSWQHLLSRHSVLRSSFHHDAFSIPVQCVYRNIILPVEIADYRSMNAEEQQAAVEQYAINDQKRNFNFEEAPLMRISLLQLTDDSFYMVWSWHHLLMDGWSMPVLMENFLSVYESISNGQLPPPQEEDKYEDYIRYIESGDKEQEEQYWRSYMDGLTESTLLPFINSISERNKGVGIYRSELLKFDEPTTQRIESFAQRHHITMNTLMQGVWSYLLHQYTDRTNVCYGVIVSGRPNELKGIEKRVGMYINTIPLHASVKPDDKIADWLQAIQAGQVASRRYQYTSLQHVQEWTGIRRDLFDSLLVFENYPVSKVVSSKEWQLRVNQVQVNEHSNYPLSILIGAGRDVSILFSYNSSILEEVYVKEIAAHFEHVLLQMISGANSIANLRLITDVEANILLKNFNDTAVTYSMNKTVVDVIEAYAAQAPDTTAVVDNSCTHRLTYKQLSDRSSQVAHYLLERGIERESIVAICMERDLDIVIAMLGILKAGAAYLPIDPDYPSERIGYMLKDSNASVVLSNDAHRSRIPADYAGQVVALDTDSEQIRLQPMLRPLKLPALADLAYVIYTSGSTGTPKGVMIEHSSLLNLALWHQRDYEVSPLSRCTSMTGIGFDAFGWEIWPYLSAGAAVYMVSDSKRLSVSEIIKLYNDEQITHSFLSTALVSEFARESAGQTTTLRYLLTGGDKLSSVDVEQLNYTLVNNYGPTENTVVATCYRLTSSGDRSPSIGQPIDNVKVY
ncbi:MAG TPA: condensation domain-containing protein, partial [Chitinophagaceae bacterium]|nr:condensation domain-containing protein [Chitinophagaceae bacterium]